MLTIDECKKIASRTAGAVGLKISDLAGDPPIFSRRRTVRDCVIRRLDAKGVEQQIIAAALGLSLCAVSRSLSEPDECMSGYEALWAA